MRRLNNQFIEEIKQDLGNRAEAFKHLGPMVVFQQMIQAHLAGSVPSRKVRYTSVDSHGHDRIYSGRVFLPRHKPGTPPLEAPLVIYQHATETRRAFTPYYGKGDETMLGAMAAELCRFVVAMPDGDGMGADPSEEKHAYCHAETTARCLLDMIRAVKAGLDGERIFDDVNYVWDGETYIVGYSEGGFISMAAVKALATDPAYADIRINGAACMGAPFDFPEVTRDLLSDASRLYDRPYIPAYLLAGWQDLYPDVVSFDASINPELLETGGTGDAVEWMKGVLGGDRITALIQQRLTGNPDQAVPARAILNEAWARENIDDPGSRLNQLFAANTLVGGWVPPPSPGQPESTAPPIPVLLAHDPSDGTVPFAGAQALFDDWTRRNVDPMGIVRLEAGGRGTGHVGGALVAIPSAFIWIDAGMPRSLMKLGQATLRAAIVDNAPPSLEANAEALVTVAGLQASNENRALLPLSRLETGASPASVGYGDRFFKVGKVKLYQLESKPVFPGQTRTLGGYTRLVKALSDLKDSCPLAPKSTYYMAVYPEKGGVALTLRFSGAFPDGTVNIKQVKNKIIGRDTGAILNISPGFRDQVSAKAFDHAEKGGAFIKLPR